MWNFRRIATQASNAKPSYLPRLYIILIFTIIQLLTRWRNNIASGVHYYSGEHVVRGFPIHKWHIYNYDSFAQGYDEIMSVVEGKYYLMIPNAIFINLMRFGHLCYTTSSTLDRNLFIYSRRVEACVWCMRVVISPAFWWIAISWSNSFNTRLSIKGSHSRVHFQETSRTVQVVSGKLTKYFIVFTFVCFQPSSSCFPSHIVLLFECSVR